MTRKEKIYLRLGCLFLAVGLVITFSCGTLNFVSFGSHTERHRERTQALEAEEEAVAEELPQTANVAEFSEVPEAVEGTQIQASDPINRAFQGYEIERLHIDSGFGEVYLDVGTEFYVEDNEGNRDGDVYISGNTLYIENDGRRDPLYITLPSEYLFNSVDIDVEAGSLQIERLQGTNMMISVGAGELAAEELISENSCQLSCGAGSITAEQMTVNSLTASVGMGEIDLTLNGIESADIKTGIGETVLNLPRSSRDYDYQVSCGAGEVSIDGNSYSGLGRSQSVVNDTGRMIRVDNGMGNTELHFEK